MRFFKGVILTAIFFFSLISIAQETITITGTVLDSFDSPLPGVSVTIEGLVLGTSTDFDGNYRLENVPLNSTLVFSYTGYSNFSIPITDKEDTVINFRMSEEPQILDELIVMASVSQNNYWTGAKLGFNIIGNEDENLLVGSASIGIFDFKLNQPTHHLDLIGSIGSFSFKEKDIAQFDDKIKKLAQSINGLSFGLGFVNESSDRSLFNKELIHRGYYQTGIRYNNYEDIGEDDETVNFLQWATSVGYEVQLNKIFNRGPLTFSVSGNLYVFNSERYNEVFNEEKGSLFSIEGTLIIPFSPKVGLLTNGTYPVNSSPVYTLGLIFK